MQLTDWMQSAQARLWLSLQVIISAVALKKQHLLPTEVLAVPEVPDAGEHHRHAKPVGRFNDLGVADRPARLNDGGGAGLGNRL